MSRTSEVSIRPARGSVFFRSGAGTFLLIALAVAGVTGCQTAPDAASRNDPNTPAPQDRVLWDYRRATAALRAGNLDEARAQLDDAILRMGGIIANSAEARKARGMFGTESNKTFIGEPYERVMAYYYRAMIYWRDGQPDNARACYRSAQLIDSDADDETHKADYVLLDYLDGLASEKLSTDGDNARQRAQANAQGRRLPEYDTNANVLVFAEYGQGPVKYAAGEFGEELKFRVTDSPAHSARLTVDGQTVVLPAYDDVSFQAITRGGRVMDHILGNKAVFKRTSETVGDAALAGSLVAAGNIRRGDGSHSRGSENTAIALGAIGLFSKLAAAATTPRADIRQWAGLPQRLSFAALKLPAGEHAATVEYFDAAGGRLASLAQQLTITVEDPSRDTVVFLSEPNR